MEVAFANDIRSSRNTVHRLDLLVECISTAQGPSGLAPENLWQEWREDKSAAGAERCEVLFLDQHRNAICLLSREVGAATRDVRDILISGSSGSDVQY